MTDLQPPIYGEKLRVGESLAFYASLPTHRDSDAVVYEQRRVTWGELDSRVNRLARGWLTIGLQRGDKVAVMLRNCAEYVELIYSMARVGIVVVPLNYRFAPPEFRYAVDFSDAKALVIGDELLDVLAAVRDELPQLPDERIVRLGADDGDAGRYVPYESVLDDDDTRPAADVDEDDLFWICFTGGTTGYPKGCEVPHRVAVQNWVNMALEFTISEADTQLIAGPWYHGLGFQFGLGQLEVGGTVVILPGFEPERVLATIESERVTITPMVPTMYHMLVNHEAKERFDVSSLRVLVSGGSPLLSDTKQALVEYFRSGHVYEYYGATEAGFYAVIKPRDQHRKVRSVGLPFRGVQLRILDEDGNDVPQGEVGEIYKRGLKVGARYYKDPEATAATYRGEWCTSSDMGRFDEEGYLYLVDRKKDMVITGGVNVYPVEIEEVLMSHAKVHEVAVIGVPHEQWGEALKAFVVPREGAGPTLEELQEHCKQRLASFKKPAALELIDALPKSAAGKILKRELREREWSGRRERV